MTILPTKGITIIEAIVAVAIFSLIVSVGIGSYTTAQNLSRRAANKTQAVWLAEEGLEATRAIRDQKFTNLTAGTKGLATTSNYWQFSGTSDTQNGFYRTLTLASGGTDLWYATSTVSWSEKGATSTVALSSAFTNWRKSVSAANGITLDTTGACVYTLDPRYLGGVKVTYDGSAGPITIPQVYMTWASSSRVLNQVFAPYPTAVWNGAANSAATTTLTTPVSLPAAGNVTFAFRWDGSVSGKNFVIKFILSDGTFKSVSIPSPLLSVCL